MSRNNKLGKMRRSQVLTYGPGAIIDFRAGKQRGGPVSVVAPGLEFWDECARPPFPQTRQKTSEPRLQKNLKVWGFRLPPVDINTKNWQNQKEEKKIKLPGFRFPRWLQCPLCYTIQDAKEWDDEIGDSSKWCGKCSFEENRRIYVVPARFVIACAKGHLEEFPWQYWLKAFPENRKRCQGDKYCSLKLQSRGGTGLSNLHLTCSKCGAERTMGNVSSKDALKGYPCRGYMPWLKENRGEECDEVMRVLLRGASNLYFPVEISALSIPPWSDVFQEILDADWHRIADEDDEGQLKALAKILWKDVKDNFDMSIEDIYNEIMKRKKHLDDPKRQDLKYDELCNFTGKPLFEYTHHEFPDSDFKTAEQNVPDTLSRFISSSIRVDRLRAVRALKGFTRINFEEEPLKLGKITGDPNIRWLPAIEVKGEGIFFSLDNSRLDKWCRQKDVTQRVKQIDDAYKAERKAVASKSVEQQIQITPKYLLLHTLSHIIMRQISLECGYDTASIRERIYCNEGEKSNNGILLYTASSDAEGTLGGLARMSEEDKFLPLIESAIENARWCSSDPLCIKGIVSESEQYNLSACHNCTLVPETSCEEFNRFLDRALLLGSPDAKFDGFFKTLLEN